MKRVPLFVAFLEPSLLYGVPPLALWLWDAPRLVFVSVLWVAAGGVWAWLRHRPDFSWRRLWHGTGWPLQERKKAVLRFLFLAPVLVFLTLWLAPERFFTFPLERSALWAGVMILYPVLSVLPQALIFRVFFFERYEGLFESRLWLFLMNGLCFGLAHGMYGNWVAPIVSGLGGVLFAYSYDQHRALKWAVLEHALYGNLIFTLGIGWFFFKHGA